MTYDNDNPTLLDVLLTLKDRISKSTNVADVAIVKFVDDTSYRCTIPATNTSIKCIALAGLDIVESDVVLVLFTTYAFADNVRRLQNNNATLTNEEDLHSIDYGIIIGKIS